MADPRFRDSMRLIKHYSLLSFMTPRQFYYPRVVLQLYHSMTFRGAPSPLELRFTIDDRPGVLKAADISTALGLQTVQANAGGYRDWPQPTQREMVRILAGDGPHPRPRHHSRASTIQEAALASDAPHRSPAADQPLPASALRTA